MFCEVKAKSGPGFGDPLEMIGAEKLRRLWKAGETLAGRPSGAAELEVRLEAVGDPRGPVTAGPSGTLILPRGTIPERALLVRTVARPGHAGHGRQRF